MCGRATVRLVAPAGAVAVAVVQVEVAPAGVAPVWAPRLHRLLRIDHPTFIALKLKVKSELEN